MVSHTTTGDFGELCRQHNLAATHQRRVIYDVVMSMKGHPSPELIYEKVRRKIPSISLATVYKNVRTFLDTGMLREVSMHHGSLRVEPNAREHHHLICIGCRQISDLEIANLEPLKLLSRFKGQPRGFRVIRIAVDVLGVCAACADGQSSKQKSSRQASLKQMSFQTKRREKSC